MRAEGPVSLRADHSLAQLPAVVLGAASSSSVLPVPPETEDDDLCDETVPLMPATPCSDPEHCEKSDDIFHPYSFSVLTRTIKMDEASKIPAAQAALQAEWDKLWKQKCWIVDSVRE